MLNRKVKFSLRSKIMKKTLLRRLFLSLSNQHSEGNFVEFLRTLNTRLDTKNARTHADVNNYRVFMYCLSSSLFQYEERVMESMRRSLKLIIFRFTHCFSFIHLARLCIVYYLSFLGCPRKKPSFCRESRARERNIAN